GAEERADHGPVQLLSDQGQVDELGESRLQLVADLVADVRAERREMGRGCDRSHVLSSPRSGIANFGQSTEENAKPRYRAAHDTCRCRALSVNQVREDPQRSANPPPAPRGSSPTPPEPPR